jgi:hypothetical protein
VAVSYSILQGFGNSPWSSSEATDGGNNLDADPGFGTYTAATTVAPQTGGDFTLQLASSPACEAGYAALYPNTWAKWSADADIGSSLTATAYNTYILPSITKDLAGKTRINGVIDMGAYEYHVP